MLTLRLFAPLAFTMASGAALAADDAKKGNADVKPVATTTGSSDGSGRDWTKIDTNGDNLVSPEEMEKWLAANPGPLKK